MGLIQEKMAMRRIAWSMIATVATLASQYAHSDEIEWVVSHPVRVPGLADRNAIDSWMPMTGQGLEEWYKHMWQEKNHGGKLTSPLVSSDPASSATTPQTDLHAQPGTLSGIYSEHDIYVSVRIPGRSGMCSWYVDEVESKPGPCDAQNGVSLNITRSGAEIIARQSGHDPLRAMVVPKRVLIVGLGDSYASGEGNPDAPTEWTAKLPPKGGYRWLNVGKASASSAYVRSQARWWDTACHRSFFNQQMFTALGVAAADRHREVVFLQYSCSGAGILDGVLAPQKGPPGAAKSVKIPSQLTSATKDLCSVGLHSYAEISASAQLQEIVGAEQVRRIDAAQPRHAQTIENINLPRCDHLTVVPDIVLLSVGGNDIGFGGLISWALMATHTRFKLWFVDGAFTRFVRYGTVVCPTADSSRHGCKPPDAQELIGQLKDRWKLIGALLPGALGVEPARVLVTGYPDPLLRSDTHNSASLCFDREVNQTNWKAGLSNWAAGNALVPPLFRLRDWDFDFTGREGKQGNEMDDSESGILEEKVLHNLRESMATAVRDATDRTDFADERFQYVAATEDVMNEHTWCDRPAEDSELPLTLPSSEGVPWPDKCGGNASCWHAYEPRQRYVRTFNDSMLTQTSSRKDGFNGLMHPTAQGHAALAAQVMRVVNVVLPPGP